MNRFPIPKFLPSLILMLVLAGCAQQGNTAAPGGEQGPLVFKANGEDFVRQGFVSKDGWAITFDHVYVTLTDVTAYQTDPPYDAASGETPEGSQVALAETYTLDLAAGDTDAEPITIGTVEAAPAGQFNAMGWRMVQATDGDAAGYTILLQGTAEKDDQTIDFKLGVAEEYSYNCGEYVGDERKGFVGPDNRADVEATFHFDHIFGDAEAPADASLNVGALGFEPLAALAADGRLDVSLADLEGALTAEELATLRDTLATLGHVGEGHCFETVGGFTGHGDE